MMVKPIVKELLEKVAKRARQIAAGAEVLIKTDEEAPVTIAANEIAQDKVCVKE